MAAATETLRLDHSIGSLRAVTAKLSEVTNGLTWNTGLGTVIWAGLTDEGKAATEDVGCTFSGGTVTIAIEGAAHPILNAIALGY
jgi:hypothetical protein